MIRTRTASSDPVWPDNAISCQHSHASFLLLPLPNTRRTHRLEALIRLPILVHCNFLAFDGLPSLLWGGWDFKTVHKHMWSDLLWEGQISRPDRSKAGCLCWSDLLWEGEIRETLRSQDQTESRQAACVYVYFSWWVGGRKQSIVDMTNLRQNSRNLQISVFAFTNP